MAFAMHLVPDPELLIAIAAGNRGAFEELYK
jgi:hypothetical protein